jgi:hypothetical protein
METILALPTAPVRPFQVGDLVVNFGNAARVLEVCPERGLLLRAMPGQGFGKGHDKWYADPAKCQPAI